MKFISYIHPTYHKSYQPEIKEKKYSFVVLENYADLNIWSNVNANIRSKEAIGFWMGFKSQTFRKTPMDYCQHEDNTNMMGIVLGTRMTLSEQPTTITNYCQYSDELISQMTTSAFRWIDKGQLVRINEAGGMCPIDDLSEYSEVIEISELELVNWMLNKDINYVLSINKKTLIIENENRVPQRLMESILDMNKVDNIQVINNFKQRTLLFKDEDYYHLFETGLKNGLENIAFETSAQDMKQIIGLKTVIERVMAAKDSSLTIYAKVPPNSKAAFKTNFENIKIIFI